ncbi:MAG: hypothetical protein IV101_03840 [Dechloromonas sp.]|uniref:hypothetical protein n=1 Tax=Dechloromonas sp. TaxID=1917218 RepID=UPI0027EE6A2C|nr:hypothetical protein [Dechloromonas sp.]MBT9520004.1 hypothetical protein [Dechloromonas sp.]
MEIALAITDPRRLAALSSYAVLDRAALRSFLDDPMLDELLARDACASHLYFGSEYCEHLFPVERDLAIAKANAERLGVRLVLPTPIANDALVDRIADTLAALPATTEVIVNDWGVAQRLSREFPDHVLSAGRQLAKMIKDPRVPAPAWNAVYPNNVASGTYARMLSHFAIGKVELDIPPFAGPDLFSIEVLALTVWAPYAYIAKGRICKTGSLGMVEEEKFAPGRTCHRECLGILEREPESISSGLRTYRRGSSMFYRHDARMFALLRESIAQNRISRLVLTEV